MESPKQSCATWDATARWRWRSPVLVIQADDDHNVPFEQTVLLTKALRERRVPHELIVIPNEIHDLLLHRSWLMYFHAQSGFLDKYLRSP